MSAGHTTVGASVSTTVTFCVAVTAGFAPTIEYVTVVVPTGYWPDAFAPPAVYELLMIAGTAVLSINCTLSNPTLRCDVDRCCSTR